MRPPYQMYSMYQSRLAVSEAQAVLRKSLSYRAPPLWICYVMTMGRVVFHNNVWPGQGHVDA